METSWFLTAGSSDSCGTKMLYYIAVSSLCYPASLSQRWNQCLLCLFSRRTSLESVRDMRRHWADRCRRRSEIRFSRTPRDV